MASSNKYKRPDGTIVIKCDTCGHWRHFSDFLIGEKNTKVKECWDPMCSYCRTKAQKWSPEVRAAVEMPEGAELTDIVGPCACGDGRYYNQQGRAAGVCFRCQGDAQLSWDDECRNYVHDLNAALRAVRQDERVMEAVKEEMDPEVLDAMNDHGQHFDDTLEDEDETIDLDTFNM